MADLGALTVGDAAAPNGWGNVNNGSLGDNSDATWSGDATNSSGTRDQGWALDDVPADFGSILTCNVQLRYAWSATPVESAWNTLAARIMSGATVLAAADSGGTFQTVASDITTTTPTNSSVIGFDYVNTAASKAQWDAAVVEVRIVRTRTKGGGTQEQRVYEADITGTYAVGASDGSKDAGLRFRLAVAGSADAALRSRINAQGFADAALRFRASEQVQGHVDAPLRFNLATPPARMLAVHFDIDSHSDVLLSDLGLAAEPVVEVAGSYDAGLRFHLVVSASADAPLRARLAVQEWQDATIRVRVVAQGHADAASRFNLVVQGYADAAIRFRVKERPTRLYLRDVVSPQAPPPGTQSTALPAAAGTDASGSSYESLSLRSPKGTSQTSRTTLSDADNAHHDQYLARFTSQPLASATTTINAGEIELAVALSQEHVASNSLLMVSAYLWRPSTQTVVGYIWDEHTALGVEWAVTEDGIVVTLDGAQVVGASGDVIVLEIWRHTAGQD